MPTSIAKSQYQLVIYVSIREAARLCGAAEHTLWEAVCGQFIVGISLPSSEVFVRWGDCSEFLPSSAMARNMDVTPFAEASAKSSNYENSVRSNDAPHGGGRHGDAS